MRNFTEDNHCPGQDSRHSPPDECRVFLLHQYARYHWSCNMGNFVFIRVGFLCGKGQNPLDKFN